MFDLPFDNSYATLPEHFYARLNPVPVKAPKLIRLNTTLAKELGLDTATLNSKEGVSMFAGNLTPPSAEPIAMAYAGHQFAHFVPELGDGRALLLGEVIGTDGKRYDIHLKGSGQTPFSRNGDGRAAIGPVIREFILSEAMHALGVPTTRTLAAVTTGEKVFRERTLPGALLTRVGASHIRIGTFEYLMARQDHEGIKALADYVINRHYPDAEKAKEPYLALFKAVCEKQAALIAQWMCVGFIHGVMNTDNMAISGETIDYGPCAFMDAYDPAKVFSSIDRHGRYAYANQPLIAQWNLARLVDCLLPLMGDDIDKAIEKAESTLATFPETFGKHWLKAMGCKIGIENASTDDAPLMQELLAMMQEETADFTLTFRTLCDAAKEDAAFKALIGKNGNYKAWFKRWRERTPNQDKAKAIMLAANPAYIPRNHQVEAAISEAEEQGTFGKMEALMNVLSQPFEEQAGCEEYAKAPTPEEEVHQTFCGT